MPYKYSKGFVALVPLLLISAILILSLSFKNRSFLTDKTLVLSENDSNNNSEVAKTPEAQKTEEPKTINSGSKTSEPQSTEKPSGNSGKNGNVRVTSQVRTPKPSGTPEAKSEDKIVDETESEVEVETEVKDGTLSAKIKIQQNGRSFQFEQEGSKVEVQGNFPVSIDKETNLLTITTPSGSHDVAVLPDTAVENALGSGLVTEVDKDQTGRNDVRIIADSNGTPIYEVRGVKIEKLLGLFNISLDRTAHISIKDGKIIKLDQSFISSILDLISF